MEGVRASVKKGFEIALCGDNRKGQIVIQHTCIVCEMYSHKNCPYIKKTIRLYMIHRKQRFERYKVIPKKVVLREDWEQIPVPEIKNIKE